MRRSLLGPVFAAVLTLGVTAARAQEIGIFNSPYADSGRLLATGGVSNIEGAGGGGISTWAVLSGYGTVDSVGGTAHGTYINLGSFTSTNTGAALSFFNRAELSYNHLWFDTGNTGARLGLGKGFTLQQDVVGVKFRVFGDVVYDQDSILPQMAVGAQFKSTNHNPILHAVGAKSNEGIDFYAAFTKLFLAQNLLVDATVRMTKGNEAGLLGYGGDRYNQYAPQFEGSVAYLFSKRFAVGGEYRTMPHNLGFTREDDWKTVYAAYFLNKNASLTLAYVNLGTIATIKNQQGVYLSAQLGF